MIKAFIKVIQQFFIKEEYQKDCKDKQNPNYIKLLWEKVGIIYLNAKFSRKKDVADLAQKTMHNYILQKKVF